MADLDARRKRAILYTRMSDARAATRMTASEFQKLSKDERAELYERGVTRQMVEGRLVAKRLDVDIVAEFKENDLSAYKPKVIRPKFEHTLDMIQNGDADMIIVWHLDRYLRRSKQLQRLIDAAEHGVEIEGATSGNIDLSTPTGRLIARNLVAIAEYESEHHAERRVLANRQRAEKGEWSTANRPFGYTQNGQPHPKESAAFRKAVIDVLAGQSIRGITRQWNEAGLTTTRDNKWTGAQIRDILEKPRYAALVTHRGKTYPGTWQPLIDVNTHRALVRFLSNPERSNGRVSWEQKHLGSGLYFCGICTTTTMQSCSGGTGNPTAYRCRAIKHLTCNAKSLDDFVQGRILDWFAREKCHLLLNSPVNLADQVLEKKRLLADLDEIALAEEFTIKMKRDMSGPIKKRLDEIERDQTAAASITAAGTLIDVSRKAREAGKDALKVITKHWATMSVTQRASAIAEVATVTVGPAQKRGPGFERERVEVKARQAEDYFAAPS